jgi:hypothetical protein
MNKIYKIIKAIATGYDISSVSTTARYYAQLDIFFNSLDKHYMSNKTLPKIANAFQAISPISPIIEQHAGPKL